MARILTVTFAFASAAFAGENYIQDDQDLADGHEETINLASGVTNVYTGVFSGSGSVKKTGPGTLAFKPLAAGGNTFSGGIDVSDGAVEARAPKAFGTGAVTVSSESGQVFFRAGTVVGGKTVYTEFTNDIRVTENSTAQTVIFYTNTIIRGNITGTGDFTLRHNPRVASPGYGGPNAAIYGTIETPGALTFYPYGTFEMHGPVKATSVYGGYSHSGDGTNELYDAGNEIGTYLICHEVLSLKTVNAMPGALIELRPRFNVANGGRSMVLLNGNDQTFAGIQFTKETGGWSNHSNGWGHVRYDTGNRTAFSSSSPATITLTGIANTTCPSFQKLRDRISLVVDAANAPGFVQEFHYHVNPTAGDIEVRAGTLSITNGATFGSVPSVTVGENGTLLVTASTNTFAAVTNLVVNGSFSCADDVVTPFSNGEASLELGDTAKINLPEGMDLSFKAVTTNGVPVPEGSRLDASVLPGVFTGAGGIVVLSANASEWTAGGPDDSVYTPGNWSDPSVPGRLGNGALTASFGTGTRATATGALALYGLQFDAPGDFTLKGDGAPGTTLSIGWGSLLIGESETARTFAIEDVALSVVGAQAWTIPSNQTLRIKDGIISQTGTVRVKGTGNLTLEGTNTIAGGINTVYEGKEMPLVTVSGLLATPNHEDQGWPTANDGKSLYLNCRASIGTESRRVLCVSNAVIEKPVALGNCMGVPSIWSPDNTTNEFRGQVRFLIEEWHNVVPGAKSEMIFSGGLETAHSFRSYGSGTIRLTGKPCKFNTLAGLNPHTGTVVVENTGNSFLNVTVGYNSVVNPGPTVKFAVTGAMTNGNLIVGYDGGSLGTLKALSSGPYTADLMEGTTQRCATVAFSSKGILKGEYPAMLEVFGANPMSTDEERKHCFAGKVQGGVGFHMCGSGTLLLDSAGTYDSTGDLEVSSGTLELGAGVVWNKGRKATVRGTGELKVNATGALGSKQMELFVGGDWKINIPSGHRLMVRTLRDAATGRLYSSGSYGAAGSGAQFTNLASHFTGGGQLVVAHLGMTICVR